MPFAEAVVASDATGFLLESLGCELTKLEAEMVQMVGNVGIYIF